MSRVPTEKQYELLRILGSGSMVLAPGRRDWGPLLRRGWVSMEAEDDGKGYLPPLRITAAGLHALADAVERYGLGAINGEPKKLKEPPNMTRLKEDLAKAREERDVAQRHAHTNASMLRQVKYAIERSTA